MCQIHSHPLLGKDTPLLFPGWLPCPPVPFFVLLLVKTEKSVKTEVPPCSNINEKCTGPPE